MSKHKQTSYLTTTQIDGPVVGFRTRYLPDLLKVSSLVSSYRCKYSLREVVRLRSGVAARTRRMGAAYVSRGPQSAARISMHQRKSHLDGCAASNITPA